MIRPETTTLYAVYWPEQGVLKVGRCWRASRYRELCATGGRVVFLMRDVPTRWELCALAQLDEHFLPAFTSAAESEHILPRGRGFTECFSVAPADLWAAVDQIYEGIVRYGDDTTKDDHTGGVLAGGAAEPAAGGAADGDLAATVRGRSGAGEGERQADAGELLPAGSDHDGFDDRGAPADAGRRRVPDVVRRRRVDVLCDVGVADGRPGEGLEVPCTARRERFARRSRFIRGGGEGERARGSGREGPCSNRSRSAITVLPSSPGIRGDRRSVQGVWQGPPAAEGLGRREVRRGTRSRR